MNDAEFERQIAGLAALDEPLRRRLYLYVASRHDEVSREEAARAVGLDVIDEPEVCAPYAAEDHALPF